LKKRLSVLIALVMVVTLFLGAMSVSASTTYDTKLVLENKTPSGAWPEIHNDGIRGVLWFNSSGYEFEYKFKAKGLDTDTDYSLIYYADPWPGNNGTVIANFTSNKKGNIPKQTGSVDLGMSLPCQSDTNYPTGAKIWLVPTDDLTNSNSLPMVAWHPTKILFEHNPITYEDTGEPTEVPTLTVLMPFGRHTTSYIGDSNVLRGDIDVAGIYDGIGYRLVIPEDCKVERPSGKRIHCLYLKDIAGSVLTFTTDNVSFSKPCVLYTTKERLVYDMWGRMTADEWVEVGSFTSIADGVVALE